MKKIDLKLLLTYITRILQSDIFIFLKEKTTVKIAFVCIIAAVIFANKFGTDKKIPSTEFSTPTASPFKESICGDGIIECNTRNLELGAFSPGIISEILVKEGDSVKKGDLLIQIDDRLLKHEVLSNEASLKTATTQYEEVLDQLNRAKQLKKDVLSSEEQKRRQFAHDRFLAQMNLEKEKMNISQVKLEQAKIIAPCDGKILKILPTLGSYVSNTGTVLIMGNTTPLHVRVQIDETDIAFFDSAASSVAIERGKSSNPIPLIFVKCDPIAQSKTILQGTSREIVDTRVVEIIYQMPISNTLFVGQRIDVFIDRKK